MAFATVVRSRQPAFRWLNRLSAARTEAAVKKGTKKRLARSVLAIAPAGLALLRSRGQTRRRVVGGMLLAASGAAAVAGVRLMRRRSGTVEQGRFTSEAEIDSRIAESFPASDPPWQP
jgi:ferric-dicitrate binding protein FerR (iron transport regulator)